MLKQGIIERFKRAAPIIRELVDDLEWIQDEFDPQNATEEESTYVKHLLDLGNSYFDESDWRFNRIFAATCGSSCEVYVPYFSDEEEWMTWPPTSIEYSGDYYFTAWPDMKLEGALVRIKADEKLGMKKALSVAADSALVKICYKQISFSKIYYSRFSLDLYRKVERKDF